MNSLECSQHFSQYKSVWIFSDAQGQLTPLSLVGQPIRDFIVVLVTCKNEEDPIKIGGARVLTRFSPLYPKGAICCHGNQCSDPI